MILPLLLLLAGPQAKPPPVAPPPATIDGLPIAGLPKQALPAKGCAAYLFSTGATKALVAMASAEPAQLRIALDGVTTDYARSAQKTAVGFGFADSTEYRRGDVTATLDMTIVTRGDLTSGAVVSDATLRIDRPGKDSIVMPVAGLIGCV